MSDYIVSKADKRWLRLMRVGHFLGCHQLPERSFFYKGYQFPVCARCTGVILSLPVAMLLFLGRRLSRRTCIALSSVMLTDWLVQYLKIKESTNSRRLVTGFIGGLGVNYLYHDLLFTGIRQLARLGKNRDMNRKGNE